MGAGRRGGADGVYAPQALGRLSGMGAGFRPGALAAAAGSNYRDHGEMGPGMGRRVHVGAIAMAFSIAALVARGTTEILGHECVGISYPTFYQTLVLLRQTHG